MQSTGHAKPAGYKLLHIRTKLKTIKQLFNSDSSGFGLKMLFRNTFWQTVHGNVQESRYSPVLALFVPGSIRFRDSNCPSLGWPSLIACSLLHPVSCFPRIVTIYAPSVYSPLMDFLVYSSSVESLSWVLSNHGYLIEGKSILVICLY